MTYKYILSRQLQSEPKAQRPCSAANNREPNLQRCRAAGLCTQRPDHMLAIKAAMSSGVIILLGSEMSGFGGFSSSI